MRRKKIRCNFAQKKEKTLGENAENKKKCIIFRIPEIKKNQWKKHCDEKQISLTDLIISSVENKMTESERRAVLKFIEKQDNLFAKIENNINQFARVANSKKDINSVEMQIFIRRLEEIQQLKTEQNQIFKDIYKLMANDN